MAITPWFKPAELSITPLPFQQIAQAGAMMQKQYDTGQAAETLLEDQFAKIKALPIDAEKRDAKLKEYKDQITNLYNSAGHNYAQMLPGLAQIEKSFKQDATYGDLGGINSNAESYAQIVKDYKDAATDGKFSGHDDLMWSAAIGNPLANYNNSGGYRKDPKTNSGVGVGFGNLYKLPEVGKAISEFMAKSAWSPTTIQGGLSGSSHGYLSSETNEFITKDEAYLAAMQFALGNPDFEQMNKLVAQTSDPNQMYDVKDKNGKVITQLKGQNAGLYKFYAGIVESTSDRLAYDKVTRDYHYDQAAADARKAETKNNIQDLNTPYDLLQTSLTNTVSTIDNFLAGPNKDPFGAGLKIGVTSRMNPKTKGVEYYKNGQLITLEQARAVNKENNTIMTDAQFNELSALDKERIKFVAKSLLSTGAITAGLIPSVRPNQLGPLKANATLADINISNWTKDDWNGIQNKLKTYKDIQASSIEHTYTDHETRDELGKYYNDNMANFYFYDAKNSLGGQKNAHDNKMYSGSELQALGVNVNSITGRLSAANVASYNVPGTNSKYSFAAPDVAVLSNKDKSLQGTFYVGRNRATIDNAYILDVFENGLSQASMSGLPMPLFTDSDILVVPTRSTTAANAVVLKIPNKADKLIEYNNAFELREKTAYELSTNAELSIEIANRLFK